MFKGNNKTLERRQWKRDRERKVSFNCSLNFLVLFYFQVQSIGLWPSDQLFAVKQNDSIDLQAMSKCF